ncbi:MAG: hypothetical protein JRK53_20855 [Deltaproteobacteria bacterium]|nr:hypothetical protein [Deltaproteobacteria bacterium]
MSFEESTRKMIDPLPAEFFYRFLESRGAALERVTHGFNAVLPKELSSILELPELVSIQTDRLPDTEGADSGPEPDAARERYAVHYGASMLDHAVSLVCGRVPLLSFRLHFDYLKSQGFDKLVGQRLLFPNAVGKGGSHAVVQARYLLITAWYSALSDERKEGLVTLAFNLESGAYVPEMAELLDGMHRTVDRAEPEERAADIRNVLRCAPAAFQDRVAVDTADFQESMNRRFRRDVENLMEYYAGLKQEMQKSLERPGLSEQLIHDRKEKIRLIPDELARKKDDLFKKYSVKIRIKPCAMICVKTRAVKLLYRLSIGKSTKTLSMTYNPVTKDMDPQLCEGCGTSTYSCTFDDQLHLLCPACAQRRC